MPTETAFAPIRTVVVAMDLRDAAAHRARFAASVASRYGARLIGAAAASPILPAYGPIGDSMIDLTPEVRRSVEHGIETSLNRAEAVFRRATCLPDAEWRTSSVMRPEQHLTSVALEADLLLLGRWGANDETDGLFSVKPADVALNLGRPVMVVPPDATEFSNARVVIGWKDSRETRRAMADALPLLAGAGEVVLTAIADGDGPDSLSRAAAYLKSHAINVTALVEPRAGRRSSEALLAVVQRAGATLLVSGAYATSRFREWALGGMTRDLLDRCPVPWLISH